jgi:NAD(P)-dependent dehydrogenase (short-subunit alcohol dehydrogenase family)
MPTVLITGGHSGIGLECAKQLTSGPGLNLVLAGRSTERMESAAQQLRTASGVKVSTLKLDVSSMASVRAAAAQCRAMLDSGEIDSLQAIILNAGAQFRRAISYSVDGYEETFATNCLGHFLLFELLLDCVVDHGRIVFTASGTHDPDTRDGKMVGVVVEPDATALANDGKADAKPLSGGVRYSTSKLCTILYAYELDRRLKKSGSAIASIAFDPGSVPETGLLRTMPKPVQWLSKTALMKFVFRRIGITMGTISFSGAALAKIAADPAYSNGSGKYFQSNDGSLIEARSSKMSYDKNRAAKLWNDSKLLIHLQPNEEAAQLR